MRSSADLGARIRVVTWTFVIFVLGGGFGAMAGMIHGGAARIASFAIIGAFGSALLVYLLVTLASYIGEVGTVTFTEGGGGDRPTGPLWSRIESLKAAGDTDAVDAWYATSFAEWPTHAPLYMHAATYYSGIGDYNRARDCLREARRVTTDPAIDIQTSYRLMDLYDGPLEDPGRVLTELRRVADRYPDTDIAARALDTIARRKKSSIDD